MTSHTTTTEDMKVTPEKYYEIKKHCFQAFGEIADKIRKDPNSPRGLVPSWFRETIEEAIDSLLSSSATKIREEINNFAIMKGPIITLLEETDERAKIINRCNENLEIGYRQACRDILALLPSEGESNPTSHE